MPRTFNSVDQQKELPWLDEQYGKREQRTYQIGKEAIDSLLKEKMEVTYKNISERSKILDPNGQGIHPNSVSRNKKLYEYYKENSKTYTKKKVIEDRYRTYRSKPTFKGFDQINPGRNKSDVRKRYKRLTKSELIERLIDSEEYIAEQNGRWITEQFEKINYDE